MRNFVIQAKWDRAVDMCLEAERRETFERFPRVREAIAELAGKISDVEMQKMNYAVDGKHRDIAEVAREFLRAKGLD